MAFNFKVFFPVLRSAQEVHQKQGMNLSNAEASATNVGSSHVGAKTLVNSGATQSQLKNSKKQKEEKKLSTKEKLDLLD